MSSEIHGVIIGGSSSLATLRKQILKLASVPEISVMLIGATGTGKELVAQQLHKQSRLSQRTDSFQALNCSGLNENLIESQLFGHKKGAFTGATSDYEGLIGLIEKQFGERSKNKGYSGTLFLDELHNMPLSMQGLLLRFLEDGSYRRLGEAKERYARVRIVAAMQPGKENRQKVRDDLYNRLAEKELWLPELNERKEDIPAIAKVLLENIRMGAGDKADENKIGAILDNKAFIESLKSYDWSEGNVRELRSVLKRALLLDEVNPLQAKGELRDNPFDLPDRLDDVVNATSFQDGYIAAVYQKFKPKGATDQEIADQLMCDARTLKDAVSGVRGYKKIEQFERKKSRRSARPLKPLST